MAKREFLFLQGLAGPFFARLGRALAAKGHGVHRINFNGGDKLCWGLPGAVDYRGSLSRWPAFLAEELATRNVTDLVLFGDCRPLHAAAIKVARREGIQIHVFEEGYIRPDFVTVEVGGVNGHSGLSHDPEFYLEQARKLPPIPPFPGVPSSFPRRAREDLVYNIGTLLLAPLFPGYRGHRPWSILHEYYGWAQRLLRKRWALRRSEATLATLEASGKPYFIFPLQLTEDYQIRVHSQFKGMEPAIRTVLSSFAANGSPDELLVVKAHPLDNGVIDWGARTREAAEALGIADRVLFVEWADVDQLVRRARGLVTVNSTTGTLSLLHGVPTVVLGDAVYDMPRVTHRAGLDSFWTRPTRPDMRVFDAFRRVLFDRCLVHGGYFSEEGLQMLVAGSVARLEAAEAPMPVLRLVSAPRSSPVAPPLAARG